jgi:hypothetical protein
MSTGFPLNSFGQRKDIAMEEEEEEVSWSWPEWLPNGHFPESTVTSLMTYFAAQGFKVFSEEEFEFLSKEFSTFIHKLELQTVVYAQTSFFDKFSKSTSGVQIKDILRAMNELSLKLKSAHHETLLRIRIDSDVLGIKRYGRSINHFQMNKFEALERCLPHVIDAIEQKEYSHKAMNYKGATANIEAHVFVFGVIRNLGAYLKKEPRKTQIQKTIDIILMKKNALKNTIDHPKDPQKLF